ncbi:UNVERIFIED_CONTAM: hypothetical protein HDU68_006076 [Siphonaria sp. JEL0065]|nr:hypothetical protein HDU68_006076 [Siphonaria sp. JEL0065]
MANTSGAIEPVKVAVYGAGLVGSYLAGMIAGHSLTTHSQVSLICRQSLAEHIKNNQNTLEVTSQFGGDGSHIPRTTFAVPANQLNIISDPIVSGGGLLGLKARGFKPQFLVITMKRISVQTAINEMKLAGIDSATKSKEGDDWFWKDTCIVTIQNGVDPSRIILDSLGNDLNVIDGMFPFNVANFNNNAAHFEQGSSGLLYVSDTTHGRVLAKLLTASGVECKTHADMKAIQYGKLLMNLNNAISALSAIPLKRELSQFQYRKILSQNMGETLQVFRAAGITPHSFTKFPYSIVTAVIVAPDYIFSRISGFFLAVSDSATSSMYEDLAANRDTEIDFLQGHISALGKQYRVETPVTDRIVKLIREVEGKKQGLVAHTGNEIYKEGS